MSLNVGLVGATGMVGEEFIRLLTKRNFPIKSLRPFASEQSLGRSIELNSAKYPIQILEEGCFDGLDLVFFSSGDDISLEWAPKAVAAGATAIDNSAAFRMNPDYPLVVPEINADQLKSKDTPQLIANPNCSTIQLVVPLLGLKKFGLERVQVSSYQAVSGGGKPARDELLAQTRIHSESQSTDPVVDSKPDKFPHHSAYNCIPQIGGFNDDGYCSEEVKIMNETKKILGLPGLPVSAFTVRVPALNGHAEAVWVTLQQDVRRDDILFALKNTEGLQVIDDPKTNQYPTQVQASGQEDVFVGRVHKDLSQQNTWLMWVVADNIWKGAALNGLQIAERLFL